MTDDEIRQLIRGAIARHLGGSQPGEGTPVAPVAPSFAAADRGGAAAGRPVAFGRYVIPRAADDGMCLIEPAVRCNHCGYCESHGH
jgi:hypothetical protein